jgi:5-carboxymethyl-2-hydroxymuconic-semialdehyde dehydrogenase
VVFGDADLDAAARTIAGQYNNAEHVCLAGTRILAERSIAEDLLGRVRKQVEASKVGDPRDGGTKVGPLIHPEAFERVTGFVERVPSPMAPSRSGVASVTTSAISISPDPPC